MECRLNCTAISYFQLTALMTAITHPVTSLFYVDDDIDDLEFFQEAIEILGEQVILFHNANDLLFSLNDSSIAPSMVFLDLNMRTKNGVGVLEEIKSSEHFRKFPILVYSTASDSATVDRCRKLGASLYIRKPTSLPALKQVLRQVLAIDWETFKPDLKNFVL